MDIKAVTLLELLVVILALVILVGVINNVFFVGFNVWNEGFSRAEIRTDLGQALELISKNLRQAGSVDALTESSITFSADLGGGDDTYRVYLYHEDDPEPNPPYTQDTYDLRWAKGTVDYGAGANLVTDIAQPTHIPFSQTGAVITMDLTATRGDETLRLRSNVRPRNL
ncbi:MAG: hypothetical protein KAJ18_05280 [Candidatus Omnitrophica bacterium]|nr:hypothetical protein [Candidatus Omnitrophota bacterium]